jgi:hypothetical protein
VKLVGGAAPDSCPCCTVERVFGLGVGKVIKGHGGRVPSPELWFLFHSNVSVDMVGFRVGQFDGLRHCTIIYQYFICIPEGGGWVISGIGG